MRWFLNWIKNNNTKHPSTQVFWNFLLRLRCFCCSCWFVADLKIYIYENHMATIISHCPQIKKDIFHFFVRINSLFTLHRISRVLESNPIQFQFWSTYIHTRILYLQRLSSISHHHRRRRHVFSFQFSTRSLVFYSERDACSFFFRC